MKRSYFLREKELFHGSKTVRRFTFKAVGSGDSYALLARANHNLAMNFAVSQAQYAILLAEYAVFYEKDRFECLPPHNAAA